MFCVLFVQCEVKKEKFGKKLSQERLTLSIRLKVREESLHIEVWSDQFSVIIKRLNILKWLKINQKRECLKLLDALLINSMSDAYALDFVWVPAQNNFSNLSNGITVSCILQHYLGNFELVKSKI